MILDLSLALEMTRERDGLLLSRLNDNFTVRQNKNFKHSYIFVCLDTDEFIGEDSADITCLAGILSTTFFALDQKLLASNTSIKTGR